MKRTFYRPAAWFSSQNRTPGGGGGGGGGGGVLPYMGYIGMCGPKG